MTQTVNGMSFSEEDGFVHADFDGDFDCISSAPGGGCLRKVSRISFGDYEDCDLAIPCPRPGSVRSCLLEFGGTSVFAAAYSDMKSGMGRAAEASAAGEGMTHVLVVLGCNTPDSGMLRATVTATEAVTSVAQDLLLRSDDGLHQASGSVCQTITVVRNSGSPLMLHGTGKHSKLGELVGRAVRAAVTDSVRANSLSCHDAADAMTLLGRYGYDSEEMFKLTDCMDLNAFAVSLDHVSMGKGTAAAVSAALFIADEMEWGLIPEEDGRTVIAGILKEVFGYDGGAGEPVESIARALACRASHRI